MHWVVAHHVEPLNFSLGFVYEVSGVPGKGTGGDSQGVGGIEAVRLSIDLP